MKVSAKESESVSSLSPLDRYKYFIKKVADFEGMWTIKDTYDDYALSDSDDNVLISFWPAQEYVLSNLDNGWKECKPTKISLDDFEPEIVPLIEQNDYLINVFAVNRKSGFILSLEEFIRDLNEEIGKYCCRNLMEAKKPYRNENVIIYGDDNEVLSTKISDIIPCFEDYTTRSYLLKHIEAVAKDKSFNQLEFESNINDSPSGKIFSYNKLTEIEERLHQIIELELLILDSKNESRCQKGSCDFYAKIELVDGAYWEITTEVRSVISNLLKLDGAQLNPELN